MQDRSTNLWYSAEYWSFKIGDELNDKYRLEVSGYSGDTGDFLQYEGDSNGNSCFGCYYHNGMKFTTYDQDNDLADSNCAPMSRWWLVVPQLFLDMSNVRRSTLRVVDGEIRS